jgi:site-specific DNA-methyltransferase (adenine-specific)
MSDDVVPISVDDLEIGEVEKDEDFESLKASIKDQGLLHPPTVRPVNGKYEVVAGKKRALALKELEHVTIKCVVREMSADEAMVLGIHENLRRSNLSWYDSAALVKKLHALRQGEHGASASHRPKKDKGKSGWSMRDTAKELDAALGAVSESIMLADAVQDDPQLRNIKDRRTALKLVRSKAKQYTAELEQAAPLEFEVNTVYLGSATDCLRRLDADIFDAVVTDPPWVKFKDKKFIADKETRPTFREIYRVMKADSFLFMFVGLEDFNDYQQLLPNYGFTVSKTALFWHKLGVLSRGVKAWEFGRDYEYILLAVKGSPVLATTQQQSAILPAKVIPSRSLVHPNEKPVPLIQKIVETCTHPGGLILDPFSGSGSHLEAAYRSGRRYIGIERDQEIHTRIVERLANVKKEMKR